MMRKHKRRRVHFPGIERLSQEARGLIEQGMREGKTYDEICTAVREATGEKLARSSLGRWRTRIWEEKEESMRLARELTERLVGVLTAGGKGDLAELARELLFTQAVEALSRSKAKDPVGLAMAAAKVQQAQTQKELAKLAREKQVLLRQKFEAQRKAERLAKGLERAAQRKTLAPETLREAAAKVRKVYGA